MTMMVAGNIEAVKLLVKAGAEVSIAAEGGVTALHAASELGNLELVQLLLQVNVCQLLLFCTSQKKAAVC